MLGLAVSALHTHTYPHPHNANGPGMEQITSFGVAGALVLVIGYLLFSNRADRTQHSSIVKDLYARITALEKGENEKIQALEKRVQTLEDEVDYEKQLRREAEDKAAAAERRALLAEQLARGARDERH